MRRLPIEELEKFQGVPFSTADLKTELSDYTALKMKISRLVKEGVLVRLRRDFFCLGHEYSEKRIEHGVIANAMYGPSYVSFETALSLYGLIPERTYLTMSAVIRHGKYFKTPFGPFSYYQIPEAVWGIGARVERTANGTYMMANPTKALCDTLLRKNNLRVTSPKTLRDFLEVDMRFDFDYLGEPDKDVLHTYATCGKKTGLFTALERMFS